MWWLMRRRFGRRLVALVAVTVTAAGTLLFGNVAAAQTDTVDTAKDAAEVVVSVVFGHAADAEVLECREFPCPPPPSGDEFGSCSHTVKKPRTLGAGVFAETWTECLDGHGDPLAMTSISMHAKLWKNWAIIDQKPGSISNSWRVGVDLWASANSACYLWQAESTVSLVWPPGWVGDPGGTKESPTFQNC
jgi:hypothetical protein